MGKTKKPNKKKLILGFIYKDEYVLKKTEIALIKKFGEIDIESEVFSFTHTKYYENEIGENLKRKFISFKHLIDIENVWKIKLFTNNLEKLFSKNNKRAINIDPGYVSLSKLILLTTKDYAHRIYLRKGIFGEVTLSFEKDSFKPLEYTYPDYKTNEYIEFFNSVRALYKPQLSL